jgi:hypothetical protein
MKVASELLSQETCPRRFAAFERSRKRVQAARISKPFSGPVDRLSPPREAHRSAGLFANTIFKLQDQISYDLPLLHPGRRPRVLIADFSL